ncbi:MAG TPA: hypothetical protein ENJ50_05085 [Planctomycetaceae bacterium]|nr:hypothetical protein [Planctomycetaceae bacterium]
MERSVREHMASLEKLAAEAAARGFRRALGKSIAEQNKRKGATTKRARRSSAELMALEEKLHAAICAQPGEKMAAYAEAAKSTSEMLSHPMRRLRAAGRIRSVGQKGRARYFPIDD